MKAALLGVVALLLSPVARAELVCDHCPYLMNVPATYVGSYWPGDRGSFVHMNAAADYGQAKRFDEYFIFDINDSATVSLSVSTLAGMASDAPWGIEIYPDMGSVCGFEGGCFPRLFSFEVQTASVGTLKQRARIATELAPGRYVIRVAVGTRQFEETSYIGQLRFR